MPKYKVGISDLGYEDVVEADDEQEAEEIQETHENIEQYTLKRKEKNKMQNNKKVGIGINRRRRISII